MGESKRECIPYRHYFAGEGCLHVSSLYLTYAVMGICPLPPYRCLSGRQPPKLFHLSADVCRSLHRQHRDPQPPTEPLPVDGDGGRGGHAAQSTEGSVSGGGLLNEQLSSARGRRRLLAGMKAAELGTLHRKGVCVHELALDPVYGTLRSIDILSVPDSCLLSSLPGICQLPQLSSAAPPRPCRLHRIRPCLPSRGYCVGGDRAAETRQRPTC